MDAKIKIDVGEHFQHLPHAPIVEAIIEIRTRADGAWEEEAVRRHFEQVLSGYAYLDSQRVIQHEWEMRGGQPPTQRVSELGLKGVRFRSADERHIVQFNRDGFVFSRLQPYEDWEQLSKEAMRLCQFHLEFARSTEIQRVGVRFINRIQLPPEELRFEDYIQAAPQPPHSLELPFAGFMHYDTLAMPGYAYMINVIKTIHVPPALQTQGIALILDIDVFTTQPFALGENAIEKRLAEMRWLKNKVFFGSVTDKALKIFQ
jgi:uncharacterized protein (TIGR04255 family)